MITVERQEATMLRGEEARVLVDWGDGSRESRVIACGPTQKGSDPMVNWSAFGQVTPETALIYCAAIALAASIAPTLSGPLNND